MSQTKASQNLKHHTLDQEGSRSGLRVLRGCVKGTRNVDAIGVAHGLL